MKILILLFFFFLQTLSYSQTHIDNLVSIKFPGKVDTSQTNLKGFSLKQIYLNTSDESFTVCKTEGISESLPLAKSKSDLDGYYKKISKSFFEKISNKDFMITSEKLIKFKGYFTYDIEFSDKEEKDRNGECLFIFVNYAFYSFTYSKNGKYSEDRKNSFFSSIVIKKDLDQIEPEQNHRSYIIELIECILGLTLSVILFKMVKKRMANK
jgi:hypothetical protein